MSGLDRVWNEEATRRSGLEWELASRVDQRAWKVFGHMEIMDEYRMAVWLSHGC